MSPSPVGQPFPASSGTLEVVTFGETMLRLSPPAGFAL